MAELVDALDLGSSIFDVRVRVSPSALSTKKQQKELWHFAPQLFFGFTELYASIIKSQNPSKQGSPICAESELSPRFKL